MTKRRSKTSADIAFTPRTTLEGAVAEPIFELARSIRVLSPQLDSAASREVMAEIAALERQIANMPATTMREGVVQAMLASALAERSLEDLADHQASTRAVARMLFCLSRSLLNLLLTQAGDDLDPGQIGIDDYAPEHTNPFPPRQPRSAPRRVNGRGHVGTGDRK